MAKIYVGVTDDDWFRQLRAMSHREPVEDVNFWRPSSKPFRALEAGEMFLFKLHSPRNVIAGGGFFQQASSLPVYLAWEAFGPANGVTSEEVLRERIAKYHGHVPAEGITCIILAEPFFLEDDDAIPAPSDFAPNLVSGRGYDASTGTGAALLRQVEERLRRAPAVHRGPAQGLLVEVGGARWGAGRLAAPRLGQGSFRVGVLDNYARRCAISGERTVPVLEAAHIKRYSDGGGHDLRNGLLLRSDLHKLFDLGYIAIDPGDHRVLVSDRIKTEFENGRDYYALRGRTLAPPANPLYAPGADFLRYHAGHVFQG